MSVSTAARVLTDVVYDQPVYNSLARRVGRVVIHYVSRPSTRLLLGPNLD